MVIRCDLQQVIIQNASDPACVFDLLISVEQTITNLIMKSKVASLAVDKAGV